MSKKVKIKKGWSEFHYKWDKKGEFRKKRFFKLRSLLWKWFVLRKIDVEKVLEEC